ncbi:MAG: SAM hydrolase/SAM-dependent halogenase family protein [Gammaproteobacteria bacterium]
MRGIVTFTTDFGQRDPFVAVMKGQVLRRAPEAVLVDITHDVARHRAAEAGFWLARIPPYFPAGTVHVAVVDPGVGSARALIGARAWGQIFLAPDNGLLSDVAAGPGFAARRIASETFATIGARAAGPTFHGRDLLAPLAAELATGRFPFASLGESCVPAQVPGLAQAVPDAGGWRGAVAAVDRFGNLLTNVPGEWLTPGLAWHVQIAGRRARAVSAYAAAAQGELVALVNAWGLVELAMTRGSAAEGLGVGRGEPVWVGRGGDG